MRLEYQQESLVTVAHELDLAFRDGYAASHPHRHIVRGEIDWPLYRQMEAAGYLIVVTARAAPTLAGFLVVLLSPNPHSAGTLLAVQDTLYVSPAYRGRFIGARLIRTAESALRELHVSAFVTSAPVDTPLDSLMKRLGYERSEIKYVRAL